MGAGTCRAGDAERMTMAHGELITIGKILRPFGVHGAVRVHPLSDVPGRYETLSEVVLAVDGHLLPATVTSVRKAGESYIVGLSVFSTPEDAAPFRGAWVQIPRDPTAEPPPGHYFQYQLIGMTVQDEQGREVGTLEEIHEYPHHHLFLVRKDGREHMIPAVRQIVTGVDLDRRTMTVKLPED